MSESTGTSGTVYLIGAGPGDPGLMTVKGRRCLLAADVVIYDYLANPDLLEELAPEVERINVGKRHGNHRHPQEDINAMLVQHAKAGRTVARLKGGDPFIFGRGGEEALALAKAGIPFQVVPGVTAATAVAAYAGIPLTHRGTSATVTFVTGQETPDRKDSLIRWKELARTRETLVFFMGVKSLPAIMERLIEGGRAPDTPAACIHWGTHPCQRTVTGTVATLATAVTAAGLLPPALIVVGDVVALRQQINWFETLPLFGRRVLVTRAGGGGKGSLAGLLYERGAEVVTVPAIQIVPPDDFGALDDAIKTLAGYDWLVLTSGNGVNALFERLAHHGKDARALSGLAIATVGAETAKALKTHGITADIIPDDARAEGLAAAMIDFGVTGKKVLLAQAEKARRALPERLTEAGATVHAATCYRTVRPDPDPEQLARLTAGPAPDYVTFTSSSTVKNLHDILGEKVFHERLSACRVAVIGPVTADTVKKMGLGVAVMPEIPSVAALVTAICDDAMGDTQMKDTS